MILGSLRYVALAIPGAETSGHCSSWKERPADACHQLVTWKDSSSPGGWRGRGKLSRYIAAAHEGSEDCRLGARAIFVTDVQP